MNMAAQDKFWAVIPAAGSGNRMGTEIPKQYLKIRGRYILEYTVSRFTGVGAMQGIVVVISENDAYWHELEASRNDRVMSAIGGRERYHSVLNGLYRLRDLAGDEDWILVHDAARPCVREQDIRVLMENVKDHTVGGLLGVPARDTMKRADANEEIAETIPRQGLWHALTPQMFRKGMLQRAIEKAISERVEITDEAQAVELAGFRPKLVAGHPDNIKITRMNDLPLAELFLSQQEQH